MLTRQWLMAASLVGGVAGFSFGGTHCKIGDDFSSGGLLTFGLGGLLEAWFHRVGGQVRFSASANNDGVRST